VYTYDISLPLDRFYEIVELTRERLKDVANCKAICGFGHVGESSITNIDPTTIIN